MQRKIIRNPFGSNSVLFETIVVCSFGMLLGIACSVFSGVIVFGALAAVFLVFAILKRPEIALLGILIATSSIIFEDQLPTVSVGISLHVSDFLLLGCLALIGLRWLVEPEFKIVRTPLDWLLLIFYAVTLLSAFMAISQARVDVEWARRAIRFLTYYLTFFVVTNLVRDRRQLNFFLNGFFLLATIVAAVMVAQYVLGSSVVLFPGRVEALNTQGVGYDDITRILPPGVSMVLIAFGTTFCILLLEKLESYSVSKFLQFGLLGLGVLFTFLRSYWGALLLVFSLLWFIFKGHDRQKLVNWGVAIILFAGVVFLFLTSISDSKVMGLASASGERISTIFNIETYKGGDSSINFRAIENEYARREIASHPWLGLGPGTPYRGFDSRLDKGGIDLRGFIHNGHYRIMLNSGLIGYLVFMGLSLVFLIRGFRYWRSVAEVRLRGVVLGFTLVYLAVLIAATVNSTFEQWSWTPVIGIVMGINEVILLNFRNEEPVSV